MTEGPPLRPPQSDKEEMDDSISIHSTEESEYDPEKEFIVTRVLAQKGVGKRRLFLILWQDYPLEEATWEPSHQISSEILDQWDLREKEEKRGLKEPFDVKEWQAKLDRTTREKERRKKLRREKRKRLGIPVQMSEPENDDSSSDEALEQNEFDDAAAAKISKAKSVTPSKTSKKPAASMRPERHDGHFFEKQIDRPRRPKGTQAVSTQGAAFSVKEQEVITKQTSPDSDSSSDVPLAQKRQKLTGKGLPVLQKAVSSSEPGGISAQEIEAVEIEGGQQDLDGSSQVFQPEPRETPSMDIPVSPKKTSLYNCASSPAMAEAEKRPRGRPPTRGKRATRGGADAGTGTLRKNVFQTGTPTKARGRKTGHNLLKVATNPSKDPKVASNRHLMRKLELQAREIADAAPDISAIGGLYDPSNMTSVVAVRPSTLRKSSSSISIAQDHDEEANSNSIVEDKNDSPVATIPPSSTSTERNAGQKICFFWNRAEKNNRLQSCANGYLCAYLHEHKFGVTVAPPPPGFIDESDNSDPHDEGPSAYDNYYRLVCYYWDRAQKNSSLGDCSKGVNCKFLHSYKNNAPVAPPPPGVSGLDDANSDHDISSQSQKHAGSPYSKAPPETTVPPWRNQTAPNPALTPANMTQPSAEESVSLSTQERPPWDPMKGNNAICHFWWKNSNCNRGDSCKLYHSDDMRLPVAPSRAEQNVIMSRITCPRWLQGDCRFGSQCSFSHVGQAVMPEQQSDFSVAVMDPSTSKLDDNISYSSTEPVRKSVKLLQPDKMSNEPANTSPANEARTGRKFDYRRSRQSNTPCRYYARGICNQGPYCAFMHDSQFADLEHEDIEMSDTAVYQDFTASKTTPSIRESHSRPVEVTRTIDPSKASERPSLADEAVEARDAVAKVPRKKVNLAQYNQQKARRKINARAKPVYFGQNELESVVLDFGDIENAQDSLWRREFPNIEKVTFSQICIAQDFQVQQGYIQRRTVFRGSLLPADADNQETAKVIEKVGHELILRSAGLLASFSKFTILLFPASKEEWKYLEASDAYPKEGRLRYLVFETEWDVNQIHTNEVKGMGLGEPYRKLLVDMIHGLNIKRFMPQPASDQDPHNYFLLFPPTASHASSFLAGWLKEQDHQGKIYDAQKPGSWDFFRKNFQTGVVLVHETAAANLHLLPDLFEMLCKKNFSFWCISSGDTVYPLYPSRYYEVNQSSLGQISATRLFPQGCALLLTPSFLVAEPKRAYDLVKIFLAKNETAAPGTWKLVCAANICDYLLDLAISKAEEKDAFEIANRDDPAKDAILNDAGLSFAHCDARNKLHTTFAHQQAKGLIASPIDSESVEIEHYFHREKDSFIVQADSFVDPDDEPALIKWFMAWAMRQLDVHRKFLVVGTGPLSAPRAHRMKEFVDIHNLAHSPDLRAVPDTNATVGVSSNSDSVYQQENSLNLPLTGKQPVEFTRHGINDSMPTAQLQFCSITGGSAEDAITFLSRANDDLKVAVELYKHTDAMYVDAQITELIDTYANKKNSSASLRILTAENDLARAREMVDTTISSVSAPNLNAITAAFAPQYDGSSDAYSPQYDGADERPLSSGSASTTHSGIVTNENGQRFVPRSIRPDHSVRKEIPVRSGFTPQEDIDRYVSPGVAASRGPNRTASMRSSPTPHPAVAAGTLPPIEGILGSNPMDIDDENTRSGAKKQSGLGCNSLAVSVGSGAAIENQEGSAKRPNTQLRKHVFKDTVAWYEEYKKTNGSGWELVFIGAHEDAIKKSGIVPSK